MSTHLSEEQRLGENVSAVHPAAVFNQGALSLLLDVVFPRLETQQSGTKDSARNGIVCALRWPSALIFLVFLLLVPSGVFASGCVPNSSGDPNHPFDLATWNAVVAATKAS